MHLFKFETAASRREYYLGLSRRAEQAALKIKDRERRQTCMALAAVWAEMARELDDLS